MDLKGLRKLAGNAFATGEFPSAEALLDSFSDEEIAAEQARRDLAAKVGGAVAVKSSVRTQIESMLLASLSAYERNTRTVNEGRAPGTRIKTVSFGQFKNGAMDTLDAPTLTYMESVVEESKGKTLWVPKSAANTELSGGEIINLAEVNGAALKKPLWGWNERLSFLNLFSGPDLSGNNPSSDALVTHQFAPTTLTKRLHGTVDQQRDTYKALRAENPGVNIHAPALAHSVGGWLIHADSGLALHTNLDTTYDRSVEVDAQPFGGDDYVPHSDVCGSGSGVGGSRVGGVYAGRAWVGQNLGLAA